MLLLALACTPDPPEETGTETGDTGHSGDSALEACGTGDPYGVLVTDVNYELASAHDPPPHSLEVRVKGDDASVLEISYGPGCCPTLSVEAVADPVLCTVVASVAILGDDCDCVGTVNVLYGLNDVSAGEWTLTSGTASATFVVP
jgi:hypothetical protein